ncbi:SUMF1/EgtB/PvdO family nonheme iron enzyme [Gemmatimonadota bacterium]
MRNSIRAAVFVAFLVCLAFDQVSAQYKEDMNNDGKVEVRDVRYLLILAKVNPANPRLDYNQDGKYNIVDPVALLISIRDSVLTPIETPGTDTTLIKEIELSSLPGGTFEMGCDTGEVDEFPAHTVELDPFEISRTEITNYQYAAYLNAALADGKIEVSSDSIIGASGLYIGKEYLQMAVIDESYNRCWISFEDNVFVVQWDKNEWPVVNVTWYGAYAFAAYYGLSLPTEAEWEYACRGGRQNVYGTGDGTIDYYKANYDLSIGLPLPVANYPPNSFGLFEMSGNVSEWVNDWYSSYYYSESPSSNPPGPETGVFRVARGGSFNGCEYNSRSAKRVYHEPEYLHSYVGFRVVRHQ